MIFHPMRKHCLRSGRVSAVGDVDEVLTVFCMVQKFLLLTSNADSLLHQSLLYDINIETGVTAKILLVTPEPFDDLQFLPSPTGCSAGIRLLKYLRVNLIICRQFQ